MSPNRTRRSKEDIIAEVIRSAGAGASKTRIMYRASLNFKQLNEYIEFLCSNGFLLHDVSSGAYRATSKGNAYVKKYEEYAKARETAKSRTAAIKDILRSNG